VKKKTKQNERINHSIRAVIVASSQRHARRNGCIVSPADECF